MTESYIAYQSLVVSRDALFWTKISTIVSIVGVLVTLLAGVVAFLALGQWKQQYNEDKKIKLMDAIIEYNNVLISIDKNLDNDERHVNRKLITKAFNELHSRCNIYLSSNTDESLSKTMGALREHQMAFLAGKVFKSELALFAGKMLYVDLK
ncbi:hypothetical protein [Enterobacter hormaechei]|uniref:hypothetical protein n=2 Tax=Enterobacter hormaechei TaxID=158836 RepID=UPI0007920421|nr:hypothetical protein [Enterobacter hormaechei]CAE6340698.1 hypothetical protein AI2716V1_1556 [Enterobacter cloacae]HDS3650482.1 hypothetical protein [Enterobacter hormaechei subsp. steigerwaltii]MBG0686100.1 hypothetical protein [Enterobacter hormaechei]MBW7666080.1 hypothetical protein [Enterobacter hormaechei]MDH1745450.1 hypothetical protein [Enterobacter hormaechei]